MLTTTLKEIRSHSPCTEGWETLLEHLGKSPTAAKTCDAPVPLLTVLESNGMDDALWVLDNCINPHICRLFAADCAERVLHLFESERPDDDRPRKAIEVARNTNATDRERADAGDAARAAAWAAAGAAAGDAARAAAWAAQEKRLRQYLEHGEVAKDMEWPE